MSALNNIATLLADLFFSLAAFFFLLRALLAFSGASFHNPISQSVFTLTNPVLRLVRPIAPFVGRVDFGCWGLAYLAKILELFTISWFQESGYAISFLAMLAFVRLLETLVYIHIIAIIILAVSSWFISPTQSHSNPVLSLLYSLTSPILRQIRKIIPQSGTLDFTPMLALAGLYVILILIHSLAP